MASLGNTQRITFNYPSLTLQKGWSSGNTTKVILWNHHYPDTKTRLRYCKIIKKKKKVKLQANTFDECRWKNPQQNISNLITHKKDTPLSSWIHSMVKRMVQHIQIIQCDTPQQQKERRRRKKNMIISTDVKKNPLIKFNIHS